MVDRGAAPARPGRGRVAQKRPPRTLVLRTKRTISWAQSLDDYVVDRAAREKIPCSTLIETLVRAALGGLSSEHVAS